MKIIVMSDSHGVAENLDRIIKLHYHDADMFIFLGDGSRDIETMKAKYHRADIRCVCGNCDYDSMLPQSVVVHTRWADIFCTHGHRYGVKGGTELLRSIARDNGCCVVLFGHTHESSEFYHDGMYFMNPGSCTCPRNGKKCSYGVIDISSNGILMNIVEM